MAKLPDIEYGPVQRSSDTAALPGEAARGAFKVIDEGLTAWGQELVKTQMRRAGTKFAEQLNQDELNLQRPSISAQELRDELGDNIPPAARGLMQVKDAKGELVDNPEIPMWAVAGALHDVYAKRAAESAASDIPMTGWQSAFKDHAREVAIARKAKVNEVQMRAALDYMKASQKADFSSSRNSARTPEEFAAIRAGIMQSNALDTLEKKAEVEATTTAEQLRPVTDAMMSDDPVAMKAQVARLKAGGADVDHITPLHREQYVKQLTTSITARERELKTAKDDELKKNATAAWNAMFAAHDAARRAGRQLTSAEYNKLIPQPGTVPDHEWHQMDTYLATLTKPPPAETNEATYWNITQSMIQDPESFKQGKVTIPNEKGEPTKVSLFALRGALKDEHFFKFVDLMRSAEKNDFVYRGAITDQEAINSALTTRFKYDLKTKNADEQKEIGHLTSMVNQTLAARAQAKNKPLEQGERDAIINEVLDREVQLKKNSWLYRLLPFTDEQTRTIKTLDVRPEIATALYEGTRRGGKELGPDGAVMLFKDYANYEPGIISGWGRYGSGKPLAPDLAVKIYFTVGQYRNEIDAELRRAGKLTGDDAKDNPERAALAARAVALNKVP